MYQHIQLLLLQFWSSRALLRNCHSSSGRLVFEGFIFHLVKVKMLRLGVDSVLFLTLKVALFVTHNLPNLPQSFSVYSTEVFKMLYWGFLTLSCFHVVDYIYVCCWFFFWDKISCYPNWPPTLHIAKDDLELDPLASFHLLSDGITDEPPHFMFEGPSSEHYTARQALWQLDPHPQLVSISEREENRK